MSDGRIVDEKPIAVGARVEAGASGTALQPDSRRSLKDVRRERAALRVKFDLQIPGVRVPGDLISGFESNDFRNDANEYEFFSQAECPFD